MAAKLPRPGLGALRGGLDRLRGLGRSRRAAALASAGWAVLVAAYAIGFFAASQARGTMFLDAAFFLVTLALPLILIWLAAFLAEELERQRELIAALAEVVGPLHAALEATRASVERHGRLPPGATTGAATGAAEEAAGGAALERALAGQSAIAAKLDALLAASSSDAAAGAGAPAPGREPGAAPATAQRRARPPATDPTAGCQPSLPLMAGPEPEEPLPWADLVRALDFPRDAEDREGFRALRFALRRRGLAQLLQAAEDVLTLLSQEGVYVDDLAADPADAAAWRRFASGVRGVALGGLGGVRDPQAVELARGLMKADPVFRDTALFFQRRFDAVLAQLAEGAGDAELIEVADTRSGRAFQLMARASGAFD